MDAKKNWQKIVCSEGVVRVFIDFFGILRGRKTLFGTLIKVILNPQIFYFYFIHIIRLQLRL